MVRAIPIIVNQTIPCAFVALICLFSQSAALAQDTAPSPPSSDYVSRAEYDKLKAEHEAMKQELDALKATVQQMTAAAAPAPAEAAPKKPISEGKLEFEFEDQETTTNLEIAQASYLLNDYMTISVGRFLNPTNFFVERQHMNWVNKLPDKPLAVYDGLLPESELGGQLRGVIPIGPTKLEYVTFVANAPGLITAPDDFSELGTLDFDNDANFGGHVAVGGHVGFIPIPQVEIGYGIQRSKVGPRDQAVTAVLQSADFNYVQDSTLFKGLINFRAQWVWSHVGNFVYDADGSQGFGPLEFNNNRNGGYVELAYRPTHIDNDYIKNFEGVFRYDRFNQLHTPVGFDEQRWTLGLNYWVTPSAVVKLAYEFDDKNGGARDQDAFMMQAAVGF